MAQGSGTRAVSLPAGMKAESACNKQREETDVRH